MITYFPEISTPFATYVIKHEEDFFCRGVEFYLRIIYNTLNVIRKQIPRHPELVSAGTPTLCPKLASR